LSADSRRLEPAATITVNTVTTASSNMLQFSSRIFMPGEHGWCALVPADSNLENNPMQRSRRLPALDDAT
ncbi:hypothetical protein ACTGXS_10965, partial [Streptococcus suis]